MIFQTDRHARTSLGSYLSTGTSSRSSLSLLCGKTSTGTQTPSHNMTVYNQGTTNEFVQSQAMTKRITQNQAEKNDITLSEGITEETTQNKATTEEMTQNETKINDISLNQVITNGKNPTYKFKENPVLENKPTILKKQEIKKQETKLNNSLQDKELENINYILRKKRTINKPISWYKSTPNLILQDTPKDTFHFSSLQHPLEREVISHHNKHGWLYNQDNVWKTQTRKENNNFAIRLVIAHYLLFFLTLSLLPRTYRPTIL